MIRKFFSCIILVSIAVIQVDSGTAFAKGRSKVRHGISARSVLVVDASTGRVLFSRSPNLKLAPASTVKLLTALVALDHLASDQVVAVHSSATQAQPSKLFARSGERFYTRDLVKAILVNSANDAAHALAVAVSGSQWKFAQLMNQKAASIGMKDSRFVFASGLPAENQYSTVYDLVQLMKEAQKNQSIMSALTIRKSSVRSLDGRVFALENHNRMLWRDRREILGKTGWTRNARHCFVGRIRTNQKTVYVAIMGSKNKWHDLTVIADRYSGVYVNKSTKNRTAINVNLIQKALKNAGFFHLEPTGYFGPITKKAVVRFQKAHRLLPDGIVGVETWSALSRYLS